MSRRNPLARREPNGRIQRRPDLELMSPVEVRRMLDASALGMRDRVWASPLGILHLRGKLTATQFAAGIHWAELSVEYSAASQSPRAPRSAALEPKGGTPPDPDSPRGVREARQHAKTMQSYTSGLNLLRSLGEAAGTAVADVCEKEQYPVGEIQLGALRGGLAALAALWGRERRK
jgi:hypothetical protein